MNISGLPAGATLFAGIVNPDGSWTVTQDELFGLIIQLPSNYNADFALNVQAIAIGSSNQTAETELYALPVDLTAVADLPQLQTTATTGAEDLAIPVSIDTQLAGVGATETLSVLSGADVMHGTEGADIFYGDRGNDEIYGYGGVDTIYGEQGRDILYGGEGDDVIRGGSGNDIIYGSHSDVTFRAEKVTILFIRVLAMRFSKVIRAMISLSLALIPVTMSLALAVEGVGRTSFN